MVDNDRFMAIMNEQGKRCILYAMNETKISVPLTDTCRFHYNSCSLYHDVYHKIITMSHTTAEWYDFNKDKAMIIADYGDKDLFCMNNMWYSPFDPAVLYCSSIYRRDCNGGTYVEEVEPPLSSK